MNVLYLTDVAKYQQSILGFGLALHVLCNSNGPAALALARHSVKVQLRPYLVLQQHLLVSILRDSILIKIT